MAPPGPDEAWKTLLDQPEVRLFLDYDGTLVPHAEHPSDASPDDEVLELLTGVGRLPGVRVAIVSGRPSDELELWLGRLPVALWGEHGATSRDPGGTWTHRESVTPLDPSMRQQLQRFCEAVPGSTIEVKEHGLAWHHRAASVKPDSDRLRTFAQTLTEIAARHALEVIPGDGVIEVRRRGIHKGLAIDAVDRFPGAAIAAIGNDRTDEDMFKALPPWAIGIVVGTAPSSAAFRVAGVPDVRRLLRQLLAARSAQKATSRLDRR